jgi:hypothetical protein
VTGCECERSTGATLGQVLLLSNSDEVENKIAAADGKVARMLNDKRPTAEIVEELYLGAFSRLPTTDERARMAAYIESQDDHKLTTEDVLWTLLNSKEFSFNH